LVISGATSHFGVSLLPNLVKWANNLGSPVAGEGYKHKPYSLLGKAGLWAGSPSIWLLGSWGRSYRIEKRSALKVLMMRELMRGLWVEVSGKPMLGLHLEADTIWELSGLSWARTGPRPNAGGRLAVAQCFVFRLWIIVKSGAMSLTRVDLVHGHLYLMSSERGRSKSTAISVWHVPDMFVGGQITKLSDQKLSDIEFKRFCEILIVYIEQVINPVKIEWESVEATVARPLEYGTPRNV
jgi:hypothetical protein